jgi:hypothetical protein
VRDVVITWEMQKKKSENERGEKKKSLKDHTFFVVFNSFISLLINGIIFEAIFFFWCYMSI